MFTTIMYGFINEVTRQPASAEIPLRSKSGSGKEHAAPRSTPRIKPVPRASRRSTPLTGRYQVLADSFKRAAGFH